MPGNVEDLPVALPPGKVAIKTADGVAGTIDKSEVDSALDNGATLVTPQQIEEAKQNVKYSTPGMEATAALGGLGSTLTLGLSDEAGKAIGGEDYVQAQRYNPGYRMLGEVAGFAAPWAADALAERTGIEGLQALGGAPSLLSKLGGATERGIAGGLEAISPEATRALATRALTGAIEKGAGVGLEGSLYGLGQSISDDALDPEANNLTAEKVLANMEKGALFAGGLGAVAGAAGPIGQALIDHLGGEGGLGEIAQKKAGEIAWRSAGGTKAMARGAEKFANGPAEVGKIWIDEAPSLVGENAFRDMSREKLADAATAGMEKYGGVLNQELGKVDAIAAPQNLLPKLADVRAELQGKVDEMAQTIGTGPARQRIQSFIDDMSRIGGLTDASGEIVNPDARVTFSQLRNFRLAADNAWAGNSVDPQLFGFKKDFHDVRQLLENRLEQGAQNVAASAGEDFLDAYKTAKARYQAFKLLDKAARNGVAGEASNRVLSLTDTISGNAGALVGAIGGHAVGAAVGSAIGAGLNHLVRTRGNFLAADLLNQLGHLRSIAAKSAETDMRVLGAASSFVHSTEMARAPKSTSLSAPEFQRISAALTDAQRNPALLEDRLSKMTDPIVGAAPATAQAVTTKATAGVMFLASKLPRMHGDGNLLQPGRSARAIAPGHFEIERFGRYLRAFKNPESVLDDMRAGRITREGVETVRVCYPALFQQMRQEVMTASAHPSAPELSYDKLVQLGVLFQMPTTEFLRPDVFGSLQANFSTPQANQGPQQTPTVGTKRPLSIDTDDMQTAAQSAASN